MNITEPWRDEKKDRPDLDIPCPILAPLQFVEKLYFESLQKFGMKRFDVNLTSSDSEALESLCFFWAYLAYSALVWLL